MYTIDFNHPLHVYFMGIGGISMSGLAQILLNRNFTVSGSDNKQSALTDQLASEGAHIYIGQKSDNINTTYDLVVYTAAIHADNPEYAKCLELNLPMISRAELLGQLMKNYELPIAISGTHGKTTTTSMLSSILLEESCDPTISVGGILPSIGGNIRIGASEYFLTEACEYTNSFLHFFPKISVILNIEEDHMDFFKDLDDIRHSFSEFSKLLPTDGTLVINGEISNYQAITENLSCEVLSYGLDSSCDYFASNIQYDDLARASFLVTEKGHVLGEIKLSVPGAHNVSNALSVIAVSRICGISFDTIAEGLLSFTGTNRRFQHKGTFNGCNVIDDYAHHPTEITATLNSTKHYPHNEVWCVFQPHTYTRTKAFFEDFAKALSLADHVVLADIYAARETDTLGVSSSLLADEISKLGTDAHYFASFSEIETFLKKHCIHNDLCITMGAGDVYLIGENLITL